MPVYGSFHDFDNTDYWPEPVYREPTMAINLDCELVNETNDAFLITVDGNDDNQVWVPKSLGSWTERPPRPLPDIIATLPEWFAKKEGLI